MKELIAREFGLELIKTLPVSESFSSDVTHFSTDKGNFVVKSPFTIEKARRERDWLIALKHLTITPNLLDYRELENRAYILYRALPGHSIVEPSDLTESIVIQIGEVLSLLHRQTADSFGGYNTWHELLTDNIDRYLQAFEGEDLRLAKEGANLFSRHLGNVPNEGQPVPVHFDFRPGNVLLHEGRVSGVIDFESARGGHPSMDFTKIQHQLWHTVPRSRDWFLAGYGDKDWLNELDELLNLYRLYHGIGGLCWCAQRGISDSDFYRLNQGFIKTALNQFR